MKGGLACLIALVVSGPLTAQDPAAASAGADLKRLSLDELIARLPQVGLEWNYEQASPASWTLVPAAQEFRDRIERGTPLTAEQWKHALTSTAALQLREFWPLAEPFAMSMRVPGWLRNTRVSLKPMNAGLVGAEAGFANGPGYCGTYSERREHAWRYQKLGELPLGPQTLVFVLSLTRGLPDRRAGEKEQEHEPSTGMFFEDEIAFEVTCVPDLAAVVSPRSSSEVDAAVRSSLSVAFDDNWGDGRRYPFLFVDPDVAGQPLLEGLGLSLDIEILHDGERQDSLSLFVSAYDSPIRRSSVHSSAQQPFAFQALPSIPPSAEHDDAAREHWSVRANGTPRGVWALWHAKDYWDGSVVIPLDELVQRERQLAPGGRSHRYSPSPDQYSLGRIETQAPDKR